MLHPHGGRPRFRPATVAAIGRAAPGQPLLEPRQRLQAAEAWRSMSLCRPKNMGKPWKIMGKSWQPRLIVGINMGLRMFKYVESLGIPSSEYPTTPGNHDLVSNFDLVERI